MRSRWCSVVKQHARHIGSDSHVPPSLGFSSDFMSHYRLKELLGSGTFADVYQAYAQPSLQTHDVLFYV